MSENLDKIQLIHLNTLMIHILSEYDRGFSNYEDMMIDVLLLDDLIEKYNADGISIDDIALLKRLKKEYFNKDIGSTNSIILIMDGYHFDDPEHMTDEDFKLEEAFLSAYTAFFPNDSVTLRFENLLGDSKSMYLVQRYIDSNGFEDYEKRSSLHNTDWFLCTDNIGTDWHPKSHYWKRYIFDHVNKIEWEFNPIIFDKNTLEKLGLEWKNYTISKHSEKKHDSFECKDVDITKLEKDKCYLQNFIKNGPRKSVENFENNGVLITRYYKKDKIFEEKSFNGITDYFKNGTLYKRIKGLEKTTFFKNQRIKSIGFIKENGMPKGEWKYYYYNGNIKFQENHSTWVNNKLEKAIKYNNKGIKIYEGHYYHSEFIGICLKWNENGDLIDYDDRGTRYLKDCLTMAVSEDDTLLNRSVHKYELSPVADLKHIGRSIMKIYDETKKLIGKGMVRTDNHDIKLGEWSYYYPDGKKWQFGKYENDQYVHSIGSHANTKNYIEGKFSGKNGLWHELHPNGHKASLGYYHNNKKIGIWLYFKKDGSILESIDYDIEHAPLSGVTNKKFKS